MASGSSDCFRCSSSLSLNVPDTPPKIGDVTIKGLPSHVRSAIPAQENLALGSTEHNTITVLKTCRRANQPGNRDKNRYCSIPVYDDSGLTLMDGTYVNANKVHGYDRDANWIPCAYIATQGPLDWTIDDFYRMIVEKDVHVIVMLTRVIEGNREKCARYWPSPLDVKEIDKDGNVVPAKAPHHEDTCTMRHQRAMSAPVFEDGFLITKNIKVRNVEEVIMGPVVKRFLDVYQTSDTELKNPHRVLQLQYTEWPDHDVPDNGKALRGIINLVEEERKDDANPARPIVVHCSAGVGRTGTFCAVHQIILKLRIDSKKPDFDPSNYVINLYQTILKLRECRSGMVQQLVQYVFCYKTIIEEARELQLIKDTPSSSALTRSGAWAPSSLSQSSSLSAFHGSTRGGGSLAFGFGDSGSTLDELPMAFPASDSSLGSPDLSQSMDLSTIGSPVRVSDLSQSMDLSSIGSPYKTSGHHRF